MTFLEDLFRILDDLKREQERENAAVLGED